MVYNANTTIIHFLLLSVSASKEGVVHGLFRVPDPWYKFLALGNRTDIQIPETCKRAPIFSFQKAGISKTGNLCESDPIQLRYLPR